MYRRTILIALVASLSAAVTAQTQNPRFGRWKLKSDDPPPALNIMTYEPYGDGGMRITVEATNAKGEKRKWGYVTLFDGKYRPMTGDTTTEETAVEVVDARTNKIMNKTGDRIGHMNMSGPSGSMAAFANLGIARKIYIHINNSNPALREDSPERKAVEAAGWEVSHDGMAMRI